jgi:hypothetical protein
MKQQHLITPPPELEKQWFAAWESGENEELSFADFVIPRAAQWGADQELETCLGWLVLNGYGELCHKIRAARRPKPPSLKEINLKHLDVMQRDGHYLPEILQDLRRAVEMAPDA